MNIPVATEPQPAPRLIRQKKENPRLSKLKLILTWLLLLLIARFFVQQRIDFIRTERKVRALILQKRQLMSSILPLKLEERYLTRDEAVEEAAAQKHQLQKPMSSQTTSIRIKTLQDDMDE